MIVNSKEYEVRNLHYEVRSAHSEDAQALSELRLQIDGETENLDRVKGEVKVKFPQNVSDKPLCRIIPLAIIKPKQIIKPNHSINFILGMSPLSTN